MLSEEFVSTLKRVFISCEIEVDTIIIYPGIHMATTGIFPELLKKSRWIALQLDEKGNVSRIEINNPKPTTEILQCIQETIDYNNLNPAIINGTAVKCIFYMMLQ
jgi:hypothetical protein